MFFFLTHGYALIKCVYILIIYVHKKRRKGSDVPAAPFPERKRFQIFQAEFYTRSGTVLSGPLRSVGRPPLERSLVPSIVYAFLLLGFPVKSFTSTNANVFEWKLRKLFPICGSGSSGSDGSGWDGNGGSGRHGDGGGGRGGAGGVE